MLRLGVVLLLGMAAAAPASAQSRDRGPEQVPPGHRPPPGMCRIWIDGLPPGQQPEPTDCATAVRERPAGARVIFGENRPNANDDDRGGKKGKKDKKDKNTKSYRDDDRVRGRVDDSCLTAQLTNSDCDDVVTNRRPGPWPQMMAAIALIRGSRTTDVQRWLGDRATTVRYDDSDRNGRPERAVWYDRAGQLVQEWVDSDRDGVADTIRLYRDGKLIRVYEK